jgi:hypothetical protein
VSDSLSEDKIQSMVNLVLQAVDQRLATVREQLVQITNNVARSHADLEAQIAECRELCVASAGSSDQLSPGADADATRQLVEAANVLTERVTFLEARVNQYTNDRVAELQQAIERLNNQLGGDTVGAAKRATTSRGSRWGSSSSQATRSVSSAPASTPSVGVSRPSVPSDDPNVAPAVARLAPLATTTRQPGERWSTSAEPIDIEELSAKMGERLSAAIERAIGP